MFVIHHMVSPNTYIKNCVFPPRLCSWTSDLKDAQIFELENEVKEAVKFITENAFCVDYVQLQNND